MATTLRPNWRGITTYLTVDDTRRLVSDVADEVAVRAARLVGSVDGWPAPTTPPAGQWQPQDAPAMRREDDHTGERSRAAVIAQHPTGHGREAGRQALEAALGGVG